MIRTTLSIALTLLATCAVAQDLSPDFRSLGTIDAVIDGEPTTLVVPYDIERERGYARERSIMGRRSINLMGVTVGENGKPGRPQLQLTFFYKENDANLLSMEIFDEGGWNEPLVAEPGLGSREITSISEPEPGIFEGAFEGQLIRITDYTSGDPKQVEGAAPVSISGTFRVEALPKE